MKILLLEDDLVDQMAFSRWIKKAFPDIALTIVSSIAQTEQTLTQQSFDLLVCDFVLPDGNATDIAAFAAADSIVCISGIDDPKRRAQLRAAGIQHFFFKDSRLQYLDQFKRFVSQHYYGITAETPHAPPAATPPPSIIDLQHLKKAFDHKPQPIREIIEVFLQQTPPQLDALQVAVADQELHTCQAIAHRLKSSFRMMGLLPQVRQLEEIEEVCCKQLNNSTHYVDLVRQINEQTTIAYGLLQQELQAL